MNDQVKTEQINEAHISPSLLNGGLATVLPWMDEARSLAAQCWCDEETRMIKMDVILAEAVAKRIAAWMNTAAFHARNEEYWRERALKAEVANVEHNRRPQGVRVDGPVGPQGR